MALITFDFDDTLTHTIATWEEDGTLEDTEFGGPNLVMVQCLKACAANGNEVRVVTSRHKRWEKDTLEKLNAFGVLHLLSGVHHTDGEWKADWMSQNGLDPIKHFDDDKEELERFSCETVKVPMHESWRGVE
jgi:hypothetical protein